ncbi:ankyrin repeat-containing domain protein [Triangularia verruculosa]|uniref:Ankyrin repeat-containing domain protein n=1 Tax=Triangularia verruculosa TaxID=2587418 RepID=A0AAN6XQ92_9PEZI|nr:ankyrin repeat-containing domain protein [Triangularia verruculosa]
MPPIQPRGLGPSESFIFPKGTAKDTLRIFFRACELGSTQYVEQCLKSLSPAGRTPLLNYSSSLKTRLKALHLAAQGGHNDIVRLLLGAGAYVDATSEKDVTPLACAAASGQSGTLQVLLEHGADPHHIMADGLNIISYVASSDAVRGQADTITMLIEHGVNPNAIDETPKKSALNWACSQGNLAVVRVLLDPNIGTVKPDEAIGDNGWTALHYAARCQFLAGKDITQFLVRYGMDPMVGDSDGWLPLHLAAKHANLVTLNYLIHYKPKLMETKTDTGATPLICGCDEEESIKWLLRNGANVNAQDDEGDTALALASYDGIGECVPLLLQSGADPKLQNEEKRTALHWAARGGAINAGRELMNKCPALLHMKDDRNLSAMHIAIRTFEPKFAEMLLDEFYPEYSTSLESDLTAVHEGSGETPLLSAAKRFQVGVVERLLKLGADIDIRDRSGKTPLMYASRARKHSEKLVAMLLEHRAAEKAKEAAEKEKGEEKLPFEFQQMLQMLKTVLEEQGKP